MFTYRFRIIPNIFFLCLSVFCWHPYWDSVNYVISWAMHESSFLFLKQLWDVFQILSISFGLFDTLIFIEIRLFLSFLKFWMIYTMIFLHFKDVCLLRSYDYNFLVCPSVYFLAINLIKIRQTLCWSQFWIM